MSGCHYPSPPPQEQERRYQHKVSLVVRYFMIPCNICLILLATSTLGFAVLLFLNNYKPPHFTPAQPPDGKSSVVSIDRLCFAVVPVYNELRLADPCL
ncbi:hypothetical protein CesoFtcFv8_010956 [Champsocephalus esox]|uniref:Agrin n=1 Tax=Champsocephalus esox TaxID=159716 RepID=A0AAN8GW73_9TELE|nr:hypothetical protein CesoFtcFv8_010956 [Champsocephalus esox]